jgi:hypothetical protein
MRQQEIERRSSEVQRKRREITGQIADLQAQLASDELLREQVVEFDDQFAVDRIAMASSRQAHTPNSDVRSARKVKTRSEKE